MAPKIAKLWDTLESSPVHKLGLEVVEFCAKHREPISNHIGPNNPFQEGMLGKMFKTAPKMRHMLEELLASRDTVYYIDSTSLVGEDEMTLPRFLEVFGQHAPFGKQHKPFLAVQSHVLTSMQGLLGCGPVPLTPKLFPRFPLSPHTFFAAKGIVLVNTAGAFSNPHLDIGFTSGFSTVISGSKLFVTFEASEKNWRIMQQFHLQELTWARSMQIMHNLEKPRFNLLKEGDTIWLGAGQPHFVLSPTNSALYGVDVANPAIAEWNTTITGYKKVRWSIDNILAHESVGFMDKAIEDLEAGLALWKNVKGLPQARTADTVAQSEVDDFVQEQQQGLKEVRELKKRMMASKAVVSTGKRPQQDPADNAAGPSQPRKQPKRSAKGK